MRNYMLGTAVALFALAGQAVAEDAKGTAGRSLDGAWTVVNYDKAGQPQADAVGMTVKAESGTLTCSGRDGKPGMTLKLAFGPNGTVQVTETNADAATQPAARAGVYVLTQDFLAISVNDEATSAGGEVRASNAGPQCNSRCSVVLKREGARGDK